MMIRGKISIVALIALTAVILVDAEKFNILGKSGNSSWVKARCRPRDTIRDLGMRLCREINGERPIATNVRKENDAGGTFLDPVTTIANNQLQSGDKVIVECLNRST